MSTHQPSKVPTNVPSAVTHIDPVAGAREELALVEGNLRSARTELADLRRRLDSGTFPSVDDITGNPVDVATARARAERRIVELEQKINSDEAEADNLENFAQHAEDGDY